MAPEVTYPEPDNTDFRNAHLGLLQVKNPCVIHNSAGDVVWDNEAYRWIEGDEVPDTVNPSLWRQSKLCRSSTKSNRTNWADRVINYTGVENLYANLLHSNVSVTPFDWFWDRSPRPGWCKCSGAIFLAYILQQEFFAFYNPPYKSVLEILCPYPAK